MVQTLEKPEVEITPQPIYQLAIGFAMTKTMLTAHQLGIFEVLRNGPLSAETIAQEKNYSIRATEMLLNGCVSIQLCHKEGDLFSNTPVVEKYLLSGKEGYLGRFMDHFNDHMYTAWIHLDDAVRTGHAQIQKVIGESSDHFFQALDRDDHDLEMFMATMDEHSRDEVRALVKAYDFSGHTRLMDVGGGTGAMSSGIAHSAPHLQVTLVDRPPVCKIAQRYVKQQGQESRFQIVPGSFFDELPTGADVILLSGILHNWSPENARRILQRCAEASRPGTTLLISEQVLNDAKTAPLPAVMCSLNMLVIMDGGQEYSRSEFSRFLEETGFRLKEIRPTSTVRQLLIAERL